MYQKFIHLMSEKGVTAYQVSKDTGISQSIFSHWKNGRSIPKIDKLKILSDYFEVDLTYFID